MELIRSDAVSKWCFRTEQGFSPPLGCHMGRCDLPSLSDLPSWLTLATTILLAVTGLLQAITAVSKAAREAGGELAKPVWRRMAELLLTVVAPIGLMVWSVLYVAGANSQSLSEPSIFYLLVFGLTLAVSIYALVWRLWIYPSWLSS
jgi:hypothetical protein